MSELQKQPQSQELLRKAAYYLILGLCVFIPVRNVLELYVSSALKALPDVLILCLLVWYAVSVRFRLKFLPQDLLFLGFLVVALVSTLLNHSGLVAYIFQVRSIGVYYILYFVVRNFRFGKKEFTGIVRMLQLMSLVLFALVLVEKVSSKTVLFPASMAESIIYPSNFTRAYSLLFNPNTYALFLDLVLLLSLFCRLTCQVKTPAWFYGTLCAGLLLTMSRSGIIILVVMLALLFAAVLYKNKGRLPYKSMGICLALTLVIGIACYFAAQQGAKLYYNAVLSNGAPSAISEQIGDAINIGAMNRFEDTLTESELEKSNRDGRVYSVKTGLKIFGDYPILGTGFGTYGSAASMNFKPAIADVYDLPYPFYSDNQFITVLVETGFVGTALFALFLLAILIYYRKDPLKLLLCVFFGWFALFYNIFEVQIGAVLFWMYLALDPPPVDWKLERGK